MIMAKYTQTVDEFYESLTQSWTWKRLTEEEKKKCGKAALVKGLWPLIKIFNYRKFFVKSPI